MGIKAGIKTSLLFTASLMLTMCAARISNVKKMSIVEIKGPGLGDSGHAKNCGSVPFNITWTPKILNPSGQVTLHMQFVTPHDMDGGTYDINLYFEGDTEPFLGYQDVFTCKDVTEYIPCPLKKGTKLNQSKTIYNLHGLTAFPGAYKATAKIKNKQGQEMICVELHFKVEEV